MGGGQPVSDQPDRCSAVWQAAPTKGRPRLRCEKPPHDPASEHHFDGTHEVIWSSVPTPHFVGRDPFWGD